MNPALVAAWLAGEAIVSWRVVHTKHRIPAPGELLGITVLFVAGAIVADVYPKASPLIVLTLFGLDVAAFLDVLPKGLGGQISQVEAAQQADVNAATPGGNARAGTGQNPATANITSRPG